MGKIGRIRKRSHRKYKMTTSTHQKLGFTTLPSDLQFSLRDVPQATLNEPTLYNFTTVFNILCHDNTLNNNWNLIKHSELFLMLCCFTTENVQPVPHKTVIVNTDFTWNAIVQNKIANTAEGLQDIPQHLKMDSFLKLLKFIDECETCPGIVDGELIQLAVSGGRHGVFKDRQGAVNARLDVNNSIIYTKCQGIVASKTLCGPCKIYKKTLQMMLSNTRNNNKCQNRTAVDSHCPWKHLSDQEKAERITKSREERHKTVMKIKNLEGKFKENLISLEDDDEKVIEELFIKAMNSSAESEDFKSLFLEQQQKVLKCTDKRGRRWHPLIIRWCFELHSKSPQAYQMLKDSGILVLPNERTLRDYSNSFKSSIGFDPHYLDNLKRDFNQRPNPNQYDNWMGLIHDEVSLRQELVFDDTGRLIGFVNLGSVQNAIDELEICLSSKTNSVSSPDEATHMFVFMAVTSLFSDFKMPVCFFPTTTIKSFALFNVFWRCVEELELRGFNVLTSTCDGASPHRKFYKFHAPPGTPKGTLIYKTQNPFAEDNRFLYFICDPVHLLKTTRNNWENSFWRNKTKKLKNNNMWITWLQLIDAFENDINESNASGLRVLHKLKADHLFLNPYLRMRVYLAAQVFSNRVAHAITIQNKPGTQETAKFVQNMNDFFDCLNANKVYTQFEFKSVYRVSTDRRLEWLEKEFLQYFINWKNWAMGQTQVPKKERKMYFISDQTWEGLQICVKSFVEVVKYSLDSIPGVKYVLATKLNQDPLEKFFGKMRQNRGAYGAFNCQQFGHSFNHLAFRNSVPIKSIRRLKRSGGKIDYLDINLPLKKKK